MKKLITLLLAAGMVFGSFAGAQAVDFKVKGTFQLDYGIADGLSLAKTNRNGKTVYGSGRGADTFEAGQRVRFQIDAVASENLSATVFFEIGDFEWGSGYGTSKGVGGFGQRSMTAGVRYAYLDWFVPNTALQFRMGLQNINVPSFTFAYSPVMAYEGTAVAATYKFNENASVTAFWARPLNDNAAADSAYTTWGTNKAQRELDNVDMFGLLVPLSFDGFKVTPYGILGMIGPRSLGYNTSEAGGAQRLSILSQPRYWSTHNVSRGNPDVARSPHSYATAWWVGLTGEITAADPFRFAWEGTYGSISYPDAGYLNRHGWYINALAEYKLDWGVPGIYAWWASGDDSNPRNGSERLPMLAQDTGDYPLSTLAWNGAISNSTAEGLFYRNDPSGTWGIGVRIRDMSFLEDLKHTLRVHFIGGTNSPTMAKYMLGKKNIGGLRASSGAMDFNTAGAGTQQGGLYLTTQDYALEVTLDSVYKIYENLELMVELGYMHLWLDQSRSVWGAGVNPATGARIRGVSTTDAIKAGITLMYSF